MGQVDGDVVRVLAFKGWMLEGKVHEARLPSSSVLFAYRQPDQPSPAGVSSFGMKAACARTGRGWVQRRVKRRGQLGDEEGVGRS